MPSRLHLEIAPQPDTSTCGPTCLHAVYRYFGDQVALEQVVSEVRSLDAGGTLGTFLACHALKRGYRATVYSYNLQLFDPTWFGLRPEELQRKLEEQARVKPDAKLRVATSGYLELLARGGKLRFEELTEVLLRRYLDSSLPIVAGLSATYLYRSPRELAEVDRYDDVRGEPSGHFVVLSGYDAAAREVLLADPLRPNPLGGEQTYVMPLERVVAAILLGVLTYDANLVIVEPGSAANPDAPLG